MICRIILLSITLIIAGCLAQQEENFHRQLTTDVVIDEIQLQDDKKKEIMVITNGTVIDLNLLPEVNLTRLVAVANKTNVGSVYFEYEPEGRTRTDSKSIFEVHSKPQHIALGKHTLSATPYAEKNRGGERGPTITVNFTVARDAQPLILPEFIGEWEAIPDHLLDLGESQGGLVGHHLVTQGGFFPGVHRGTFETCVLDLSDPNATWEYMAPIDNLTDFWTHGAIATKGSDKWYVCGGYLGPHPGKAMDDCFLFDLNDGIVGSWTRIPSLLEPRAGGGLVYIEEYDAIFFAMGAERPFDDDTTTLDRNTTYWMSLGDANPQWIEKNPSPYLGNHIAAATATDCEGNSHYFFMGGQEEEDEYYGNIDKLFEYLPATDTWVERANLPVPRGHFTTSVNPVGCGFVVTGGVVDGNPTTRTKTNTILYYDINANVWNEIGNYPTRIKTPVCGVYSGFLYCTSGYQVQGYKRQLFHPNDSNPTSSPTTPGSNTTSPTEVPTLSPVGSAGSTMTPTGVPILSPVVSGGNTTAPTGVPTLSPVGSVGNTTEVPTLSPVGSVGNTTEVPTLSPVGSVGNTTEVPTLSQVGSVGNTTEVPTLSPLVSGGNTTLSPVGSGGNTTAPTGVPTLSPMGSVGNTTEKPTLAPSEVTYTFMAFAPTQAPTVMSDSNTTAPTSPPTLSPTPPIIKSLEIYDVTNSSNIFPVLTMKHNMQINTTELGTTQLSIHAKPNKYVRSVTFVMLPDDGNNFPRRENKKPYALIGDDTPYPFVYGTLYSVTTTPWSEKKGKGIKGAELTINFTLV